MVEKRQVGVLCLNHGFFSDSVRCPTCAYIAHGGELLSALKEAVQDCSCSVAERASGHHVDCRAPSWKELIARVEGRTDE